MATYLRWDDEDKYYHLCASLEGAAGQVLWDAGPQVTNDSIIRLLQMRFGTELQAENRCCWDFAAGTVQIGDHLIHTFQSDRTDTCRHILVNEDYTVPPWNEANIPVRMLHPDSCCSASDWVVETHGIRPKVVTARTSLNRDQADVVARVCNYSDTSYNFKMDSFLGLAEPVSLGEKSATGAVQGKSAGKSAAGSAA